jgi:hypothetical protein
MRSLLLIGLQQVVDFATYLDDGQAFLGART